MEKNGNEASHAFMEVTEPSDMNLPPMSANENLPDDVIAISPLTPTLASLSAQKQQLWMDTECEVIINTVKASDTIRETDPLFGSELISTKGMQRGKVATHKCSECSEVFETRYAFNKHLITHRPERSHVCSLCQEEFTRHDLLTGHMVIHKKKKDYRCSSFGCQKMYCDYRSLQRHCARQHGTSLFPPSTQPCPPLMESPKLPAVNDGASTSTRYHSNFPPPEPRSAFRFQENAGCGASYTNYTLERNPNFNCKSEDSNLSHAKHHEIPQSWSAFWSFDSEVNSNHLASGASPGGYLVDPLEPETIYSWEHNMDFLVTNFQTSKEALTTQPNKEGMRICNQSSYTRKSQPNSLKRSTPLHEPPNNKQVPLKSGVASCSKLNIVRSSAHEMDHVVPFLPPAPKTKKILKPANIPTPPLPSPKPTTKRRPRTHTSDLVSPSQVAMASFSKKTTPSDTLKGVSATAKARKGKESGERIYLKWPPRRHEHSSPSCPEVATTSCEIAQQLTGPIFSSKDEADFCDRTDQEVQLSPLVMPVSVPVSSKEPTVDKQRNVKKSRHPGVLQSLITPVQAAGGYPSQLRSPTYLADHLLNFDPPPYTPPPMLSPLRPGTGLYFNTLPKYQPIVPPPNIYSAFLDDKDEISLIVDNTVTNIEPTINVGSRFQAEIPLLCNPLLIRYDEHPAQLTWAPWGDLPTNPRTQQKVTEFVAMCCSSALPGGGTNTDLALHCLHEAQGDRLAALDLLLVRGDYRTSCHPLSDYHYAGSDHWTAQEMRLFQKMLLKQTKDFLLIHQVLQTKSVAQCVEYYYATKKVKKFKQHWRKKSDEWGRNSESCGDPDDTPKGMLIGLSTKNWEYTCEVCGRVFHNAKSLCAHMKAHRQRKRKI